MSNPHRIYHTFVVESGEKAASITIREPYLSDPKMIKRGIERLLSEMAYQKMPYDGMKVSYERSECEPQPQ